MERASKISHAEVINNPDVQAFLAGCTIPHAARPGVVTDLVAEIPAPSERRITVVVAIDGGFREVPVQERFPAATVTFFNFGPLLLRLQDLDELDASPFLAPEDLARLKKIQRYSLVLPTRNVSLKGRSLRRSVRETLQAFFSQRWNGEPSFLDALRWLLFRGWDQTRTISWILARCPNEGCTHTNIELTKWTPDILPCPVCGEPIYLVDTLRLHEVIDEDQGAGGILSYLMMALEHLALVHVVKILWDMKPQQLRQFLFIKDGPLAFFGQTAPLSTPMRELAIFLQHQPDLEGPSGAFTSLLNVVGLEKSGPFVDHAAQMEEHIPPGSALMLNNDYIYRYIIPGDPDSPHAYGANTYWGNKMIYRASDRNTYVATVPAGEYRRDPHMDDFPNLPEILSIIGRLRCSMYDNALVPIALANKLVSMSDFPSSRILEAFARGQMQSSRRR